LTAPPTVAAAKARCVSPSPRAARRWNAAWSVSAKVCCAFPTTSLPARSASEGIALRIAELPVVPDAAQPASAPIDVAALREALSESITGEVRFDRLSRALYSTDASVYQIVPLGVVLPKTEEDIIATLKVCNR